MRTSRVLVLSILALGVGFVAARWSVAQPTGDSSRKRSDDDSHNLWAAEVTRFVGHLQDTRQTNTLALFYEYESARQAWDRVLDIDEVVAILQRLRDGRTNSAMELLEERLDRDLHGLAECYKNLGAPQRQMLPLKVVYVAREYRARFPSKQGVWDQPVADAFKALGVEKAK